MRRRYATHDHREHLRFPGSRTARSPPAWRAPDAEPAAYALFAHCFTCSKDLKAAGWISRALVERGIAVLRFDFTGIGESEGDFAETDFSSNLDDLVAAADFLRREREAPRLLVGHSLGGAAVLAAAARIPEARGGGDDRRPQRHRAPARHPGPPRPRARSAGRGRGRPRRRTALPRPQAAPGRPRRRTTSAASSATSRKPLLLFHSPVDQIVGIENARRLFQAAKHPKSFVSLDRADHLLSDERDARYAGEVLAAWARRYLQAS